jgi:DNA-binding response OmpR family regulator
VKRKLYCCRHILCKLWKAEKEEESKSVRVYGGSDRRKLKGKEDPDLVQTIWKESVEAKEFDSSASAQMVVELE